MSSSCSLEKPKSCVGAPSSAAHLSAASSRLCAAAVPLLAAVSYLLPLGLVKDGPLWGDFGPEWLGRIDYVLTGRLSMIWKIGRASCRERV